MGYKIEAIDLRLFLFSRTSASYDYRVNLFKLALLLIVNVKDWLRLLVTSPFLSSEHLYNVLELSVAFLLLAPRGRLTIRIERLDLANVW
jgi:predicted membrane chloride channel (bestrophin family)